MLGLKHCQVYKRKAKRTYYGWQDTGLSLPLPPCVSSPCSQIQLLSEAAPTESKTALRKCGCNFLFRAEPLFRVRGCFFGVVSSTVQLSLTPDRFPPSTQRYPDLLNHNKLFSDVSGTKAEAANPPAFTLTCGFHELPDELCESVKEPVIIPLMSFHQQEAKPGQMC